MEANFVLSQKGTNLLKDDENHLYRRVQTYLRMMKIYNLKSLQHLEIKILITFVLTI